MAEGPPAESAIADLMAPRRVGPADQTPSLRLHERTGLQIWQIAAWRASGLPALRASLAERLGGAVPDQPNHTTANGDLTVFWIAPRRFQVVSDRTESLCSPLSVATEGLAALVDLSHARTVVRLSGAPVRTVLAKLARLDWHPATFPPGHFAQTSLGHHVSVSIHAVDETTFDLHLPRSYARSAVETLIDAAAEFGLEIGSQRL
jgi:heterotetrameric sarcosine oxidase gamma subunit